MWEVEVQRAVVGIQISTMDFATFSATWLRQRSRDIIIVDLVVLKTYSKRAWTLLGFTRSKMSTCQPSISSSHHVPNIPYRSNCRILRKIHLWYYFSYTHVWLGSPPIPKGFEINRSKRLISESSSSRVNRVTASQDHVIIRQIYSKFSAMMWDSTISITLKDYFRWKACHSRYIFIGVPVPKNWLTRMKKLEAPASKISRLRLAHPRQALDAGDGVWAWSWNHHPVTDDPSFMRRSTLLHPFFQYQNSICNCARRRKRKRVSSRIARGQRKDSVIKTGLTDAPIT